MPDDNSTETVKAAKSPSDYSSATAQHGTGPIRSTVGKPLPLFPLDIPVLNELQGKRIILASASPRRKQLLSQIGLTDLEIIPSTEPENLSKSTLGAFEYVSQTSSKKCLAVYIAALESSSTNNQNADGTSIPEPALVIAADTVIVAADERILEKPRSEADHVAMLKLLRDQKVHKVYTAVTVLAPREDARHPGYNAETIVEETSVVFDADLGDDMILAYVRTREGADKAGGYGIQGMGSLLIERIEGAWDNVVGLPLRATLRSIERVVFMQDGEDDEEGHESEDDGNGGWLGQFITGK
ncbi:MAG: hypothetical protein M1818_002611 [Claussenomyces sp. TS43310]|nr:MAG: hypothetical protein M1818_002611 [Claussenomyces sp. TS43310]